MEGFLVHRLPEVEAWIAFHADIEHRARESMTVILTPMKEVALSPAVHPVNRGFNSVIEAAVHGTRYLWNKDPETPKLIDHHRGTHPQVRGTEGARGPRPPRRVPGDGERALALNSFNMRECVSGSYQRLIRRWRVRADVSRKNCHPVL